MPRKALLLLLGLACIAIGAWASRRMMGLLRHEPGVSSDLLSRQWVEVPIGSSGVVLDAPWRLQSVSVPLPREMAGKVRDWTWVGRHTDGLNVMASRITFAPGIESSLEGAADGMASNVRAVPGTASVAPRRSETTLLGRPAIEVEARIERQEGEPLLMHGIVVLREPELVQLLSIARADQPLAAKAWERMRDSIRSR